LTNSELRERLTDTIALLNIPGIGRGRFTKLVATFKSPAAAMQASIAEIEAVSGFSRTLASAVKSEYDGESARQMAARIIQLGWTVLFTDSPEYPQVLAQIPDAPPLLFRMGQDIPADTRMAAIVGTRHASESGRQFAHALAGDLTRAGVMVVSGMAEGIDSAAHRGALDAGGRTVAVWGTPLDKVFPASNRALAEDIRNCGAVYSEYLPGDQTAASNFPERNRIISGMAEAVIVIEAGRKSGALITAQCALDQGRELFAVPGWPGAVRSLGTNHLIKQGARLLTAVEDVFDELPRLRGQIKACEFRQMPELTEAEKQIVGTLASGPQQIDQLCRLAGLPVAELTEYLLALELRGVIQELSGKRFVLAEQ
jgi:DNA processing protein